MEAVSMIGGCVAIEATDPSQVSAARLAVQRMGRELGFDDVRIGRVGLLATEAVTNMLRHGGGGTLLAASVGRTDAVGIELLAIDRGPGMADFRHSTQDGVSSAGTAGIGLGAMHRQSDELEVYTRPGAGTIVRMAIWDRPPPAAPDDYEVGAVLVPRNGEALCGDAWAAQRHARGITFLVADGLGHGPDASRAAQSAVEVLRRHPEDSPIGLLDRAHGKLRATRGAAVALIRHDAGSPELTFAGVGNISACVWDGETRRAMVSHNGIVGHNVHKSEEYRYPWTRGLLVAHSDGLESQWDLKSFPGIAACHPSIVAAMLLREHSRKRDDVVVLVARKVH